MLVSDYLTHILYTPGVAEKGARKDKPAWQLDVSLSQSHCQALANRGYIISPRQQWIHYSATSIIPQDAWAQVGVEIITTSWHKMILISVGDYKGCWSAARNWLLPGRWWDVWLLNSRFWLKTHKKNPLLVSKATTANGNVSLGNNNMKFCISQIWRHKEKNVLLSV